MNFVEKAIFEKARKTVKIEENQRKSLVFRLASIKTARYEALPKIGPGVPKSLYFAACTIWIVF